MSSIAIVGAGVSGLAAARSLSAASFDVVIFEKSRGVSGRAASRTKNGVRFDHGANFFKLEEDDAVRKLVLEELPTDDLIEVSGEVWTFGAAGELEPGDPGLNAAPKYNYRTGISMLGKLLAEPVQSRIRFQTRIGKMEQTSGGWELTADGGGSAGTFDRVLLTMPAPQIIALMKESRMDDALRASMVETLGEARYHRQFTFVFAFEGEVPRPEGMHAAVNVDAAHDIAWIGFENDKEGRVPDGQTVVIVQMNPAWSDAGYDEDAAPQAPVVREKLAKVLGTQLPEPLWWDRQRWGFAHPYSRVEAGPLRLAERAGLFVAGDGLFGRGRVHLAIRSGLEAALAIKTGF